MTVNKTKILEALKNDPSLTIRELTELTGYSESTIVKSLRQFRKAKYIESRTFRKVTNKGQRVIDNTPLPKVVYKEPDKKEVLTLINQNCYISRVAMAKLLNTTTARLNLVIQDLLDDEYLILQGKQTKIITRIGYEYLETVL